MALRPAYRLSLGDENLSNNDRCDLLPCPIQAGERRSGRRRAWR